MTATQRRTGVAAGLLAGVAAVLGLWAAGGAAPAMERGMSALALPELGVPPPLDQAALAATAERPLFSASRRPPPAAPVADAAADPPPASRVLAVAVGPQRSAAVLMLTSGKTRVLMQGEQVDGWVLASVAPDRVVLRSASQEVRLTLASTGK